MIKFDERYLLAVLQMKTEQGGPIPRPHKVAGEIGIPAKRAAYIFEKWTNKGWYDYGVNVGCGWLTDEGMKQ